MTELSGLSIPINVSWLLTNNCNYDCGFCWRVLDRRNVTLEEALLITEKLARAGVRKISWAGGEPLLFRGIGELISATKDHGIETMLITNGSLIDRIWKNGLPTDLDWLNLPLEGIGEEINTLCGRQPGHYARTVRLFDTYKNSPIQLKINTVATRLNVTAVPEIADHLDHWQISRWKVFQFYPVRGIAKEQQEKYELSDIEFSHLRDVINRHPAASTGSKTIAVESQDDLDNSYFTLAPDGSAYVSEKGRDIYLGDLKTAPVEEVFDDARLHKAKYALRSAWLELRE